MFTMEMIVKITLGLLVAAAIFGLLFFLIGYIQKKFPEANPRIFDWIRVFLVVMIVLFAIGFLLSFISNKPVIVW